MKIFILVNGKLTYRQRKDLDSVHSGIQVLCSDKNENLVLTLEKLNFEKEQIEQHTNILSDFTIFTDTDQLKHIDKIVSLIGANGKKYVKTSDVYVLKNINITKLFFMASHSFNNLIHMVGAFHRQDISKKLTHSINGITPEEYLFARAVASNNYTFNVL